MIESDTAEIRGVIISIPHQSPYVSLLGIDVTRVKENGAVFVLGNYIRIWRWI